MEARSTATLLGLGMLLTAGAGRAQVALTYHALTPCRIVDTRFWDQGSPGEHPLPLAGGETRSFDAIGLDLRHQGGAASGCDVPRKDASDLRHRAEAIVVNLVAVNAAGPGDLRVFAGDQGIAPLASVINYVTGQTIAVGTSIPLRSDGVAGGDFQIRADVSGTHVVADVIGYYSRATSTTFLARMQGILIQGAGTTVHYYTVPNGQDYASSTLANHQMRVPRGCTVSRLQVDETVPMPAGAGNRVYTLWAGSTATVPLLTCSTGNGVLGGFCQDSSNVTPIPLLAERLVLDAFVSATTVVPATDAMVTFEMVCR